MIFFAAQLDSFRITKIGDRILSLHTYEKFAEEIAKLTSGKMGKEYVVVMIPSENAQEIDEFRNETIDETKTRFRKRMNALITDIAKQTNREPGELREELKLQWKKEGMFTESTNELSLAGLATVITRLVSMQHGRPND